MRGYLQALRERCDQTGAMLIIDEIQTGFGRTGKWFGFEHAGIVPDIIAVGKAIAGGVPMGAVCWRAAHGPIGRASHGSTFGGNPLACAAAIAALTTIRDEGLVEKARDNGEWFIGELNALACAARAKCAGADYDRPRTERSRDAGIEGAARTRRARACRPDSIRCACCRRLIINSRSACCNRGPPLTRYWASR